jgi:hypothetical protein
MIKITTIVLLYIAQNFFTFETTTETILWRQISDLSGQFSDHSGQIFVFSNDKFVGDMGHRRRGILYS